MPVGDVGEALEAAVAEQVSGPEAEPAGGGAGEGAVQGVDFGEQPDVGLGVPAGEGARGGAAVGDGARGPMLAQQAGDLRPREAGQLGQEAADQPLVRLAQAGVVEPLKGLGHERVGLGPGPGLQGERPAAGEELADLGQGLKALGVERHDHPPMIRDPAPFRLISRWNQLPLQAHFSLEKTHS